ncbi:MAG TPA: D-alanine--D-alanine ligase [Clostridia bacterium]|nr:D-alanine--D-alanine ligase [Clostridia bacterium]
MGKRLRVLLLFGGRSGEHEVSLQSAASVLNALDKNKYEVVTVGITKEGHWLAGITPAEVLEKGFGHSSYPVVLQPDPTRTGLLSLDRGKGGKGLEETIHVVFPVLHGTYGEDGCVQGLLELAGLPYVGSGVLGSALAMDKLLMKTVFARHGFPQARFTGLLRREWQQVPGKVISRLEEEIGYPCFVKPANLGSSVGISKANNRKELERALTEAALYDRKIIVEENIEGREIELSILGNDVPEVSVPGEIIPSNEFYDYEAKYLSDSSKLVIPADLPSPVVARLQELAAEAFLALDCAGMVRADFFVRQSDNQVLINEVNTIPGFTRISMYPKLWEASGLKYPDLLDRLIQLALERYQEKECNLYTYHKLGN